MKTGKIILGVVAGLAAGAMIGILFAPEKGSDSRHKIAKKGEDYLEAVKEKFNSLLEIVTGKANGGKIEFAESGNMKKSQSKESAHN